MSAVARIRTATVEDVEVILGFIRDLAEYQGEKEAVRLDAERLRKDGFGIDPAFEVLIAEIEKEPVGMALYYQKYSTWRGRVLYLEDIYVAEHARNANVGNQLMDRLEDLARQRECALMAWQVADWNEHAIRLYRRRGAHVSSDWLNCTVELSKEE